jgi:phosphohistidine phosphatase
MARQLWLLRHADAEPHGTRADAARRLTERGQQQARVAGAALAELQPGFDAALFSPKVRARQTAEIAAQAWSVQQRGLLTEHPPLAGGFDAPMALEALDSADAADGDGDGARRVLLVGHEPDLSQIVAQLGGGQVDLKKGGLAVLRLEGARGELVLVLRPRELALIAGVPLGGE